jgi:hypothetical protein
MYEGEDDEDITSMDTTSPIHWSWSSTCFRTAGKHLLATVVTASYGFQFGRAPTLGCAPIGPNLIHSPRGQDMVTQHCDRFCAPHCFDVSRGLRRNLGVIPVPLESLSS